MTRGKGKRKVKLTTKGKSYGHLLCRHLSSSSHSSKLGEHLDTPLTPRLAISQAIQFELTELTAKTQFSQSVLEAAGRQSSQFRGHRTD
jgi:hypothetical protein